MFYATILAYAICGTSLTVLTGWAGQVSLGQMAFAGIGALIAANLTQGISLDIGWGNTRLVNVAFNGEPFWFSIVIAAVVTAILAAIIGIGSLRVRGLMLAVSTFAFAVAAQQYLYHRPILNGHNDSSVPFTRGQLFGIDFTGQRPYYYAVLLVLVVLLWVIARLRRSGVGRTMIAVRDNADAAAAYTVSPTRSRMQAFALAGGIAGLGGALLAGVVQSVPYTEEFFLAERLARARITCRHRGSGVDDGTGARGPVDRGVAGVRADESDCRAPVVEPVVCSSCCSISPPGWWASRTAPARRCCGGRRIACPRRRQRARRWYPPYRGR